MEEDKPTLALVTAQANAATFFPSSSTLMPPPIHLVKFGDGSVINIEGCGTVLVNLKNGDHQALTGVYHISRLTANIVSIGQLDEKGFKILIEVGVQKIWDVQRRLLVKVSRTGNRLYVLNIDVAKPICLAAQGGDTVWHWHSRFGHVNFCALRMLAQKAMVRGLPRIDHVDQVSDSCLAGKQLRLAFPSEVNYRT